MKEHRTVAMMIVMLLLTLISCSDTTSPRIDYSNPVSIKPAKGNGSEANPYTINSLGNLYWISRNESEWDKHFVQTGDIDASYTRNWDEDRGWTAIGYFLGEEHNKPFTGSYDGGNYVIDRLYLNRPDSNFQGLFGRTAGAYIANVGLTDVDITGNNRVGALVGNNRSGSVVTNSYSTGSVAGYWCVGGLVGGNWTANVSNSYSVADIVATSDNVGGLVGYNGDSSVSDCYSTGSVTGASGYIGGMIGMNVNSIVSNSYWNAETSGQESCPGGAPRSTAEMVYPYAGNTYIGWDFAAVWAEDVQNSNNGYPFIRRQR